MSEDEVWRAQRRMAEEMLPTLPENVLEPLFKEYFASISRVAATEQIQNWEDLRLVFPAALSAIQQGARSVLLIGPYQTLAIPRLDRVQLFTGESWVVRFLSQDTLAFSPEGTPLRNAPTLVGAKLVFRSEDGRRWFLQRGKFRLDDSEVHIADRSVSKMEVGRFDQFHSNMTECGSPTLRQS